MVELPENHPIRASFPESWGKVHVVTGQWPAADLSIFIEAAGRTDIQVVVGANPGEKFPYWNGSPMDGKLLHPEVNDGFLGLLIVGPSDKHEFWNEVARLKQERGNSPETT